MSQNASKAEYEEFKRRCERQRAVAKESPCFHPGQCLMECYGFQLGPWALRFTLDRFIAPSMWHGTISYMQEISSHEVRDKQGHVLFDAPEEGMMRAEQWENDIYQNARDLLGDLFGPLIHGEKQQVVEARLGFALQWLTSEREAQTLDS